jgi:hypothetical protein
LVDFAFSNAGPTVAQQAAQVVAYLYQATRQFSELNTLLTGMQSQAAPGDPWLNVPFPEDEYALLKTDDEPLPVSANWGDIELGIPTGTSSGRGDSVCVNTRAVAGGKHGRGRHFLPFLSRDAVSASGILEAGSTGATLASYDRYILNDGTNTETVDLGAVVYSPTLDSSFTIVEAVINPIPSRLRSRTR